MFLFSSFIFVVMSLLILMTPFCSLSEALKEIVQNQCELKLVADYEFFRVIGNRNYANAARYLINMVERVNGIFGPVDWGLDITGHRLINIGFTIKEIKIFDKPNYASSDHFNAALRPVDGADPMAMLRSFSIEEGTNGACLCLLVTAKALAAGVLGLANVRTIDTTQTGEQDDGGGDYEDAYGGYPEDAVERGICAHMAPNGTMHRNTALISVRRRNELMITRVVDLVAAHEFGHAFGSLHDDVHDAECVPQRSRDGRYVMWESANTGYERNHYLFSPCSVRAIHRVLYVLAHRCFVAERRALCGNGILEAGEQCDCGAQIGGPVGNGDRCCTAACRLRPSALCSPRHSECCTDNCTFINRGRLCQARSEESCKDESRCSGTSDKCPPPNALPDGTACPDEGKCRVGQCVSFCASLSADLLPCLCEDGVMKMFVVAVVAVSVAPVVAVVRLCNHCAGCPRGQCVCMGSANGTTTKQRLMMESNYNNILCKFFSDYIVFIVVIGTLAVWCPCGAYIMRMDQQKHTQLVAKRNVAEHNVQVVRSRKRVAPQRSRTMNGGSGIDLTF